MLSRASDDVRRNVAISPIDALLSVPVAYRWVITLVFVALLIALSVTPGVARPGDNIFAWLYANTSTPVQKALHVVCYATLSSLWMWTLSGVASFRMRALIAILLSLGLGIALEWYQTQVPGRFGTIADVVLNTIGVIIGLAAAILFL